MKGVVFIALLALLLLAQMPAFAGLPMAAIGIQNDADYVRLKQAACASQVVLTDLQREPNNRVVAVMAATLKAAAVNPRMTQADLQAFASAFDSRIQTTYSSDTRLSVPVNFLTAVRFDVRAAKQDGMRADFGLEILQMLGINQDYQTAQQDPSIPIQQQALMKFLDSQGLDLINNANTNLVLTYGFMGLDAAGKPNAGVRAAFVNYLVSQSIEPFPTPATLVSEYPGVAAAVAGLPANYAALQAEKTAGFANMQSAVIQQAGSLIRGLDEIIDEAEALDALQRSDYVAALANPNQAYVDAARARRLRELEELSRVRAEMNASLSVMSMAGSTDAAEIGEYIGAAGSVIAGIIEIGSAFVAPSPGTIALAVCGGMQIYGTVSGLINAESAAGKLEKPSIDEQILGIRTHMAYMHDQLNHRFDAVDNNLEQVLLKLGDTSLQLNAIRESIYELQSNLNRMNQRLFGAILGTYQHDFVVALDSALGYRQLNGYDLAYSISPCYVDFESDIHLQSTDVAYNALAGDYTCQMSLDNVQEHLGLEDQTGNYGWYVNDFREFPLLSGLYGRKLYDLRVSNPTAWATAANAYAELAGENPWWFAHQRRNQPSRLDLVRTRGEQTRDALRSFGSRQFISALVQRHRDAQEDFMNAANDLLFQVIKEGVPAYPITRRVSDEQLRLLNIWADPAERVAGWPDPSMLCYECGGGCTVMLGPPGNQLGTGTLPLTSGFPQSGAVANQHNLGLGTLAVVVVASWDYASRRCVVRWYQPWYSDGYAKPNATTFIYHDDGDPTTPDQLYEGYWARGTQEIQAIVLTTGDCELDPEWDNPGYFYIIYGHWNGGQNLYAQTLANMDTQEHNIRNPGRLTAVHQSLQVLFDQLKTTFYNRMLQELDNPASGVGSAAKTMSSLQALLEAYISLGYPQSMDLNQLLHGILRGSEFQYTAADGTVKHGTMTIGAEAIKRIYLDAQAKPATEKPDIRPVLGARLDALQAQLDTIALPDSTSSNETHPLLTYALANLAYVGAGAQQLANDDSYIDVVDGTDLVVPAAEGVLANDAPCPNPLEGARYIVTARFDNTSPVGGQRTTAQGGTVTFDADGRGGFTYQAPAGFTGVDWFQYRACGGFDNADPQSLYSNSAKVRITVVSGPAILSQPQPVTVVAGQTAVMQIGVVGGPWLLNWRENGVPLQDDGRVFGTHTNTLAISAAQLGDTGQYDVALSQGSQEFVSTSAALTVLAGSISDIKSVPDTSLSDVACCAITRTWPDLFYVEAPDRSVGIQVRKAGHGLVAGDVVALSGNAATDDDGERFVLADTITKLGTGSVDPLSLVGCALGGSNAFGSLGNGQVGTTNGYGLNNIGLLIRTTGKVTYTDPAGLFFDVWDGCIYPSAGAPFDTQGGQGIRVSAAGMTLPQPGDVVSVTGISSLRKLGDITLPEILVSSQADIDRWYSIF